MRIKSHEILIQYNRTRQPQIVLTTSGNIQPEVEELKASAKDRGYSVEIKVWRERRSLDANAYMWTICNKIAERISVPKAPITKDDVYRKAIREVGQFTLLPIRNDAVEQWIYNWAHGRTGWICENLGDSKLEGYTNIASYYGSSVYDSAQMSRLVDYIVEEAKGLDIETLTPAEIARMNQDWGK